MTSTATGTPVSRAGRASRRDGWLGRLGPRLGAAAMSGALLAVAFPPYDLWFLAPIGVALLTVVVIGQSLRRAALLGLMHGLATFLPLLSWMTVIGADAWVMLALLESVFVAAMAPGLVLVWRLPGRAVWVACLWVAQEAARARLPFGGFPWGRLAFAETASPYTPFAALGGAPLVSWVTALSAALLALAALRWSVSRRRSALLVAAVAAIGVVGLALPVLTTPDEGGGRRVTAALVQGGVPGEGMDFLGEREQVLRNHVEATERLAQDVRRGVVPAPDLVIWPENASDIDPFTDDGARTLIDSVVRDIGVPVLVGSVVNGPGPDFVSNTGVVWDPSSGPGERYVKRHPVPFGEYIPFRAQLSGLVSRLDQIPRDFFAADSPGNLRVGPAEVGDVICFEIAYDSLVRDVVDGGAQVVVVQTNNATYNGSGQPQQQLAMSRLRAVEHGRPVLVAATSGISAVVAADGTVRQKTAERTAQSLIAEVQLRSGVTVADRVGAWPEGLLALAAAMAVAAGWMRQNRRFGRDDQGSAA